MLNYVSHGTVVNTIVVVLVVAVIVIMTYNGKKKEAMHIILSLVIKMEKLYGNGKGDIKYASVLGGIYPRLPFIVRLFIAEQELDNMIESAVVRMKTELEKETLRIADK